VALGLFAAVLALREPIIEFNGVLGTRDDNPRLPLSLRQGAGAG